jgi:transcriptional regulator with XRE-family HTH domain
MRRTPAAAQTFPSLYGSDLVRLRRERGMSQGELARKLGIVQSLVSFVESDVVRFSPSTEARLVRVLWPFAAGDETAR